MANSPITNATSSQTPLNTVQPPRAAENSRPNREPQPIGGPRSKLFFERYRLRENPFGVTPNPRYLYESKSHREARASLIIGLQYGVGFQALIAPPGMGKTTILFDLLERFDKVARTAFLFQIQGNSRDFLRYLLSELGGEADGSDLVHIQDSINQLLIRERRAGKQTIIFIDEAQSLNTSVLETLRLLSNFETSSEKLLNIVLAGQPLLAQKLATPEAVQLYQRISIVTTLTPFGLEDTKNYIEHRLKIAGYQGPPLFTSEASRLVWERSSGIPREINTLCFNAMLLATAVEQKQVDSGIMREVVTDLKLDRIRGNLDAPPKDASREQIAERLAFQNKTVSTSADMIHTDDVVEAARTLLEFRARLQSTRS